MLNMRNGLNGIKNHYYWILFFLWTIQGVIAFIWLLIIPTDSTSYSIQRIALLILFFLFILVSLVFTRKSRSGNWPDFSNHTRLYNFLYILSLVAFFLTPILIIVLNALGQTSNYNYVAYAERLTPLAFVIVTSALEWYIWHTFLRNPDHSDFKTLLKPLIYVSLCFAIIAGVVAFTGWGISPTLDGFFGHPTTPLLEWQIVFAIIIGIGVMFIESHWKSKKIGTILFILTYLFACSLWLTDPLVPGFFATPPRAPNFEPYPFSDAQIYAQYAQSALVGDGFLWPDIPTRPLYVAILTWMHALVGQNYYHVIILQTVVLAFFPATLYLLGRELGSHSLGVMLALLVTFRDMTANHAAPFASGYSYSKLFFSETPTALLLAIFTLMVIKWMKTSKPKWYVLTIGGFLGLAALIRLQSVILLAPLVIFSLIIFWIDRRTEWKRGVLLIITGLIFVITPWFVRNYFAAGGLVVDNPISQSMVLARRWSGDNGNTLIPQRPGETTAQYTSRLTSIALENLRRDPTRILNVAANHFFNNLLSSLHIFPVRDRLESPAELLWPEHAFWQTDSSNPALLVFYTLLLALGLASAWQVYRWLGLLPFGFSLSYHAWTALFFSSGDRFLLPIDWTWILYYCLGILAILRIVFIGLRNAHWFFTDNSTSAKTLVIRDSWQHVFFASVIIVVVGLSLPLTEKIFPERYPVLNQEQLATSLDLHILESEIIVYGRAIYPRFYDAGDGEPGSGKLGYGESDEPRLVFWMVGSDPGLVIVPLENAPDFFPHASDIWVVGKLEAGVLLGRTVKVEKEGVSAIYTAP